MINLNDFYADPSVTISNDGLSALMQEDAMLSFVVLANDPSYGDPEVIVAGESSILTLDFSFIEGEFNDDEMRVSLFDATTYLTLDEFFTSDTVTTSIAFDLSSYVGLILGFQIELRSFDNLFTSTVNISELNLSNGQTAKVSEPGSITIICLMLIGFAYTRMKSA